ncbi:MAG: hypothetical protein UU39_C0042G0005 [Candidatus Woesebacteria bacterium GW2011_GWD1_41_12]|uniref:DUF2795 domain-containing protein n=2 Tax=Candidatus Woeseibacteriota TaxID=1752722 RepID=A0A1F8CYV7_9BACT|nr:MAG: hypothetical protein UU39_C0042G0005 [Candidatus Woesebacteria bacterium GW2011_GWD1_41_12]OGM80725.1 MAG: hypothetical protein A2393_02705 [Candidatus Woesebacteria bacterium RIFOXYB1_FULL_41_13]
MKDVKNAISHLKDHQKYPATKADLVKECDDLSDFSGEDKKWFMDHLMDKTYESADEVIKELGLV